MLVVLPRILYSNVASDTSKMNLFMMQEILIVDHVRAHFVLSPCCYGSIHNNSQIHYPKRYFVFNAE